MLCLALLAQSGLWLGLSEPSSAAGAHDDAAATRSTRLDSYVETSAGDAKILNPILHADTASGRVVDLI
ncbi:MAG: hypothetical protein KDK91_09925, partial [Gammaproteobacteria bacterium]|nr:hypothetical protein [Gammaproteobacteria bacterium]